MNQVAVEIIHPLFSVPTISSYLTQNVSLLKSFESSIFVKINSIVILSKS